MSGGDSVAYRIPNWERFERNRDRDKIKSPTWFSVENRLDGDFYVDIVSHQDGAAHMGVWLSLLMVASSANARGMLVRADGAPHTADSLARKTRMPAELIQGALDRFESDLKILETVSLVAAPVQAAQRPKVNGHAAAVPPAETTENPEDGVFPGWWARWIEATSRNVGRADAEKEFKRHVKLDKFTEFSECSESYWGSREVSANAVMAAAKFIATAAKDSFKSRWPAADEKAEKRQRASKRVAAEDLAHKRKVAADLMADPNVSQEEKIAAKRELAEIERRAHA